MNARLTAIRNLVLVSLLVSVLQAEEDGRGVIYVETRESDKATPQETPFYQGSYALLIANSDYEVWPDLPSIPDEMEAVRLALLRHGFQIYRGKVLQNLDGDAMREAYRSFVNDHGFDAANRLVLFYAGHGYTRGKGVLEKGYIVPVDAPSVRGDDRAFARVAIEMTDIDALMRRIESRHALFLFDSCFSGSIFATRTGEPTNEIPHYITMAQREAVRYYITSGSADEEVPAHSTFTPAFADALNRGMADWDDDGYTLGSELALYLRQQVSKFSETTVHRGTVRDRRLSQGDIVFVTPSSSAPRPEIMRRPLPEPVPEPPTISLPARGYFTVTEIYANGPYSGYSSHGKVEILKRVQDKLKREGHYQKIVDGLMGKGTQDAINAYQAVQPGLPITGKLDEPTLRALKLNQLKDQEPPPAPPVVRRPSGGTSLKYPIARWADESKSQVMSPYEPGVIVNVPEMRSGSLVTIKESGRKFYMPDWSKRSKKLAMPVAERVKGTANTYYSPFQSSATITIQGPKGSGIVVDPYAGHLIRIPD